jgi:predicted transcriptional regulator
MSFKKGDVVVLRADKIYEGYGKPVNYYLVLSSDYKDIVRIHEPIRKETIAVFHEDLIAISKA